MQGSETSSELDFTNRNTGGPVANSTFNTSKDSRQDMFESSDDDSPAPPVRVGDQIVCLIYVTVEIISGANIN